MSIVYLSLGSNLGDSYQIAQQALLKINDIPKTSILKTSSFYRSKPLGPQDQADFLNAVIQIQTELSPQDLLIQLQMIEHELGRVRKAVRFGPRTLDLDILLFDEHCLETDHLTIPHYDLHRREFVLYPLFEIKPNLIIPKKGALKDLIKKIPKNHLKKWSEK